MIDAFSAVVARDERSSDAPDDMMNPHQHHAATRARSRECLNGAALVGRVAVHAVAMRT